MWSTRDLLATALLSAVIAVVTTVFFERKLSQLVESKISARYMDMQLETPVGSNLPMMGAIGNKRVSIPPPVGLGYQDFEKQTPEIEPPAGAGKKWTPL